MGGSDDERTKKNQLQGVPPAKAAHSHPEGNVVAIDVGDCGRRGEWDPFWG